MGMFARKSDLAAGPDLPLEQVMAMKKQGYSNNQVIQTLQRDGYTSSQIFDAISQSEMGQSGAPAQMDQGFSSQYPNQSSMQQMPQMPQMQGMPPMQQMPPMQNMQGANSEEMIEAIIDEKWNELVKDINKVIDWKQKADTKLLAMEQQMSDLKDQFDKLHSAIIGKINDYDKHMMDVGTELSAMEKVFSKVLPSFVDNVNELNRITERFKSAPPPAAAAIAAKPAKGKSAPIQVSKSTDDEE